MTSAKRIVCLLLVIGLAGTHVCHSGEDTVHYLTQIKPLLRARCYACHGALKQAAGLRLDTVDLMLQGGDANDPVIVPRKPSLSILLDRVAAADITERMPPEHEGEPLSAEQVQLLRDWIRFGAQAPHDETAETDPSDHWAFRRIIRPPVPSIARGTRLENPIDTFLARKHHQHGLVPQIEAPRIILIRRLYLDLIGIPPTIDEITAFEDNPSPDFFEQVVDDLLDDPRHGERWARHWMDIWRYSDWWGLGEQLRNSQKHIWHWRDWIVAALNSDTPYDEMVRLMLAGDELHPNDLDKLRATGYLARNYFLFNRDQWMEETVEHVSKSLLGLTMNCAKCHDHKYDPIGQVDFYRLRAFFEPYHVRLDVVPGEPDTQRDGIPRVYDGWPDKPTYRYERGQTNAPDKSTVISPGVPAILAFEEPQIRPVTLPVEAWNPERRPWVFEAHLSAARAKLRQAKASVARARDTLAQQNRDSSGANHDASDVAEPSNPIESKSDRILKAEAELKVAQARVELAQAELTSIQRRTTAMRARWTTGDNSEDPAVAARNERQACAAAVRAERQYFVAQAKQRVAVAKRALLAVAPDKKEGATKELAQAEESLDEALKIAQAEIEPPAQFIPISGATWAATRFVFSGKDDPYVEYQPQSTGRRSALADWITDRRNPLTARVAANHIWMRHMGRPLVQTPFDFGRNGARPSHRELLDWLAAELIDSGWSMKHLHRVIVGSAAYRMSSSNAGCEENSAKDPDNLYWWRRTPIRMESQVVRDSILAHAGQLDLTMGGPPVPPARQVDSVRRSLYFFHSNNQRNLFLTTFDEASVTECYQREQSIVPQQTLALSNSRLVLDAAPHIAQRLSAHVTEDRAFVRQAFKALLGITAGDEETAASIRALQSWRQHGGRARELLVWTLLNHNDFVTIR